jgi:hypothetical protein
MLLENAIFFLQKQKEALAGKLALRPRQVEVWFQNRRARYVQYALSLRFLMLPYSGCV